jgi:hypothetical protein
VAFDVLQRQQALVDGRLLASSISMLTANRFIVAGLAQHAADE